MGVNTTKGIDLEAKRKMKTLEPTRKKKLTVSMLRKENVPPLKKAFKRRYAKCNILGVVVDKITTEEFHSETESFQEECQGLGMIKLRDQTSDEVVKIDVMGQRILAEIFIGDIILINNIFFIKEEDGYGCLKDKSLIMKFSKLEEPFPQEWSRFVRLRNLSKLCSLEIEKDPVWEKEPTHSEKNCCSILDMLHANKPDYYEDITEPGFFKQWPPKQEHEVAAKRHDGCKRKFY
ncbi:uncharacterized protein LOC130636101 isoform X2 [Hydractinia symbiolongicarpus]|uniref:uncharacterized protein LOC130636101 isoform X2 n=1 Tax=Hydractinia symbiolongicarpus TaxID=13093 RepID=UPI00254BAF07|nr:uncharacterized protein LOC130636101 isoform X2 [Hydractinia symbiolongicarpus]